MCPRGRSRQWGEDPGQGSVLPDENTQTNPLDQIVAQTFTLSTRLRGLTVRNTPATTSAVAVLSSAL